MLKTKEVLAAGIVRDIEFISHYAMEVYLSGLDQRKVTYKVLKTFERNDGVTRIRIIQQYNNSPLINLNND